MDSRDQERPKTSDHAILTRVRDFFKKSIFLRHGKNMITHMVDVRFDTNR